MSLVWSYFTPAVVVLDFLIVLHFDRQGQNKYVITNYYPQNVIIMIMIIRHGNFHEFIFVFIKMIRAQLGVHISVGV